MTITDIQHLSRRRQLELRAVHRLLLQPKFEDIFAKATKADVDKLVSILKSGCTAKHVKDWMASVVRSPLALKSYRELREMGKLENVPNYSRITRNELIKALEKKNEASVDRRGETDCGTETTPASSGNP